MQSIILLLQGKKSIEHVKKGQIQLGKSQLMACTKGGSLARCHRRNVMMDKISGLCKLIVAKHTDDTGYSRTSELLKVSVSTAGAIIWKWK